MVLWPGSCGYFKIPLSTLGDPPSLGTSGRKSASFVERLVELFTST